MKVQKGTTGYNCQSVPPLVSPTPQLMSPAPFCNNFPAPPQPRTLEDRLAAAAQNLMKVVQQGRTQLLHAVGAGIDR